MLEATKENREQLINDEVNHILSLDSARKAKAEELAPWVLKAMTLEDYYQSEARRIATYKIDNLIHDNERVQKVELHLGAVEKQKREEFESARHIGRVSHQAGDDYFVKIARQDIQPRANTSMLNRKLNIECAIGQTIEFYVRKAGVIGYRCTDINVIT